jgi:hypothetical protein
MQGPILGLDDRPRPAEAPQPPPAPAAGASPTASADSGQQGTPSPANTTTPTPFPGEARTADDEKELSKWPPYRGKPVSEVGDALKYAAPIAAQAEKLVIGALDLSGRGLSKLAKLLEDRRQGRDANSTQENEPER